MTPASRMNDMLRWVCMVLFILAFANMIYSIANIPLFYQRAVTHTLPEPILNGINQVNNAELLRRADIRGMTVKQYVIYRAILDTIYSLGFYIVAFLIVRRARGQWFLWFTALVLFFIPSGQQSLYMPQDKIVTSYLEFGSIFWAAYPLFLYLFPNGKAVPRWMRWVIGPLLIFFLGLMLTASVANLIERESLFETIKTLLPIILPVIPLALIAQVIRYLRVSTIEERQQTKWVLGGLVVMVVGDQILTNLFHMADSTRDYGFPSDATSMFILILPVAIGISILRYRLYDIDLIIRRTLQYGLLTVLLGLVYYGLVVLLGQLFQGVTGQNAPVVIVISTLVIAAIFNPLRTRLQSWIDRRFYRSRYNAVEAMERFSQNLRHEVDLPAIERELIGVVSETVQPETVSLWTRKAAKR